MCAQEMVRYSNSLYLTLNKKQLFPRDASSEMMPDGSSLYSPKGS